LILFEDELQLQELKFIWKWENNKLPNSLNEIFKEKQDRLCGRRFAYLNNNPRGVHNRLTKRANTEINVASGVMSKDTMVKRRDTTNSTEKFCGIYTVGWNYRRKRPNTVGKRPTVGIIFRPSAPNFFTTLSVFIRF
jgi:hypothetical protein